MFNFLSGHPIGGGLQIL
jgi:hypothetical protein